MELGEKLLLARQEAGMSQRQLCGDEITRNMLSQIEHGTAKPSMKTLRYLAGRLEKPVSYFLEEEAVVSPNQNVMADARTAFDRADYEAAADILKNYRMPDEIFDREMQLLKALTLLGQAEEAIAQGKTVQAKGLLEERFDGSYLCDEVEYRRLRLLARLPERDAASLCSGLPELDEDLLLRAEDALQKGRALRAAQLLDAAEHHSSARWNLLRGKSCVETGKLALAISFLQRAEDGYPRESAALLERCYRDQGDFQNAYLYACKLRET